MPCLSGQPVGETYFPSLPEQHLPTHWSGQVAPSPQSASIHIITSVGGSLENSQVITDCLSQSQENFQFCYNYIWSPAPLYQTYHSHSLGKLKQRRPWWYFPSYAPVWNIMEQCHYLHLVYLVLLPPHIYYKSNQSVWGHRVWGPPLRSVFEVKITIL